MKTHAGDSLTRVVKLRLSAKRPTAGITRARSDSGARRVHVGVRPRLAFPTPLFNSIGNLIQYIVSKLLNSSNPAVYLIFR